MMIIIFDILKGTSRNMQAKDMERLGKEDLVVLDHKLKKTICQLGFVHVGILKAMVLQCPTSVSN